MQAEAGHLGLIAGSGALPLMVAEAARRRGVRVSAVALRGESSPALAAQVDAIRWRGVGQLGGIIRALKRLGVRRACMAGGVTKARLFTARPDFAALRLLWRCRVRADDGLLRAIAATIEAQGIRVVDSTLYLPEAMAPAGILGRRQPTMGQWRDLALGLEVAHTLGRLDVGQMVVVREGVVLAVEAVEGTDACLARAGRLALGRRAVAVKAAKPQQDMRFDVPTVGVGTLEHMAASGVEVLGVEAGRTLLLAPEKVVAAADRLGLALVGLERATP